MRMLGSAVPRIVLLIAGLSLLAPRLAHPQADPERRTTLQLGVEGPLRGDAPLAAYAYLLWNRPHLLGEDVYLRVALAPVYVDAEVVRDRWPAAGHALGLGVSGGLFANSLEEYRRGEHEPRESFSGHGAGGALSWYALRDTRIGGRLPLESQVRLSPGYAVYERDGDTASRYRLPADSALVAMRAGIRAGGVPPELVPQQALELSLWHEATYRAEARAFGLPEHRLAARHWTQRTWARAGATLPILGTHGASVFLTAGTTEGTDTLSAFRLGGTLGLRSELPLLLRGFHAGEVFAERFVLLNVAYWLPALPWTERVRLGLAFDHARVDDAPGHPLRRSGLSGAGADLAIVLAERVTLVAGYGYGIDARRGGGYGGHEVSGRLEIRFR